MLIHEYMKHRSGYSLAAGAFWVGIYRETDDMDAPVVVIECLKDKSDESISQVAAEVLREHFGGAGESGTPHVIWIEKSRNRYRLLRFPLDEPYPASVGFAGRYTLGAPEREPLREREVEVLTRSGQVG